MRPASAAFQPGDLLHGTYEIVRHAGRGGMGELYEARHRRLRGRYAVKVLREVVTEGSVELARFRREAEIASALRHPNIVTVIDFNVTEGGSPYLVMEYLEGHDLSVELQRAGRMPLERALALIEQIVAALALAHGRGVVHRDLKPHNVFLVPPPGPGPELVKLLDFGISKMVTASTVTGDASIVGTPQYMSPEQAEGRAAEVDGSSDQFALAVMVYETLAGRRPFEGDSISAILYAITTRPPPPLTGVPDQVDAVLRKALSKRKHDRYSSIVHFWEALASAARGTEAVRPSANLVPTLRPQIVPERGPARATRRRGAVSILAAALVAGGAVGVYQLRDDCERAEGFGGRGCYACPVDPDDPEADHRLMNSCASAECEPFDNAARAVVADLPIPPPGATPPARGAPATEVNGPSCAELPNPVYIAGGNVLVPVIAPIAQGFAAQPPGPGEARLTIVFKQSTGCEGLATILDDKEISGPAVYWGPDGRRECVIPPGTRADIGTGAAFASSCRFLDKGLPDHVSDEHGPVETFAFVVPRSSSQRAISAEAAFNVFGHAAAGGVEPWTDEGRLIQRGPASGTQAQSAAIIGLPADRWKGRIAGSTEEMLEEIRAANRQGGEAAERTIGVASYAHVSSTGAAADVRPLAFQARGQRCAFWPSSTQAAKDLRNVREGRYRMWGPYHFFARNPPRRGVQRVINAFVGSYSLPGLDLIELYAKLGLVPQCAMKVRTDRDGGPVRPFQAERPCGCYYDLLTTGRSDCAPCRSNADCPTAAPNCFVNGGRGYCEAGERRDRAARVPM